MDRARFSDFDARGYRTVDARAGYAEWASTYEATVEDAMDVDLLERLRSITWHAVEAAADLGCGTGRTGRWLRAHGAGAVDGVDVTPQMLERAAAKSVYRELRVADVTDSGLEAGRYDLVVSCLVDEHLADVEPLYREAHRLARRGGHLVLVGYHPHFIMASGMPTHYDSPSGEPVAIETHVHLLSEHVGAGLAAGWSLLEFHERVADETWLALKPKWRRFKGHPVSFALAWRLA